MSRDDLLLCIERHATSKVRSLDDLHNISTLGFRGEALASIAAVSKLTITTRQKGATAGYRLRMRGGKLESVQEVGSPEGTVVEVKDLFYNIPARRKFLKTARTETNKAIDVFTRLALGFEDIHFVLESDQKMALNLPPSDKLIPRLALVLGRKVAEQMVRSSGEFEGIHITAYMATPEMARTRADKLYVYVNRRHVKDTMITKAIVQGYGQRLMKGLYPQAVIFIDVEPSLVDVNVHPAKQEVRFQDSLEIFHKIVQVVDSGLGRGQRPYSLKAEQVVNRTAAEPSQIGWQSTWLSGKTEISSAGPELEEQGSTTVTLADEALKIVGQLNSMYILCEGKEGLLIIDQHAAHERILYDRLMKSLSEASLEVQNLLLPKPLELGIREKRILDENKGVLLQLGIELEDFGGQAVLLRSIPSLLERADWESTIGEIVRILEYKRGTREALFDHVISVLACHGAIRAGDELTKREMESLLQQLSMSSLPTNCPHGRPVWRRITYHELEKMFKRVV